MGTIIALFIAWTTLTATPTTSASQDCDCQTEQTQYVVGEDIDVG